MDKLRSKAVQIVGDVAHEKLADELSTITTNLVKSLTDKIGNKSLETTEHVNGFQENCLTSINKLKGLKGNNIDTLKTSYQSTADEIKGAAETLKGKLDSDSLKVVGEEIDSYATNQYEFIIKALSKIGTV